MGKPDLIVTMPKSYTLGEDVQHLFRSFVLPLPIEGANWLRGIEFHPGNLRAVRQATLLLDTVGIGRQREAQSGAVGYADFNSGLGGTANSIYDWTVGVAPRFLPDGAGIPINRGAELILQLRFRATGKPEPVQAQVGLYFAKKASPVEPITVHLGVGEYYLQPGKTSIVTDSLTLPVPVRVWNVVANLHPVGTQAKATVLLSDGTERTLLSISDWDSDWRRPYWFAKPVALPAGTTLAMELRFDNTAKNPRNPKPEIVRASLRHLEDMASVWITVVPEKPEDRPRLEDAIRRSVHRPKIVETGTYLRDPSQRPLPPNRR